MSTSAITAAATSSTTTSSSTSTTSAYSSMTTADFLTLLTTELENQNPLDPTSSSEMASLCASMTQISQADTTNSYLSTISDSLASLSSNQALSYLDKTITYENSSSKEVSDTVTGISYKSGSIYLTTKGGDSVALSDVISISQNS